MRESLDRRTFLKGAATSLMATGALGLLACTPKSGGPETALPPASMDTTASEIPTTFAETFDANILVVGGGITGLAAAVQAGQSGKDVYLIESGGTLGGNGSGVEGTFGMNTSYQKTLGIELELKDLLATELEGSQWRSNGLLWKDFMLASADNFQWLLDCGVQFDGRVESYGTPDGKPTFHWFTGGRGSTAYVPAMERMLDTLGVTVLRTTKARKLLMKDGKVSGVYAEGENKDILINAKAVILATGGFANDNDLVAKIGYRKDNIYQIGAPGHDGFGYKSAIEAGAWDTSEWTTFNTNNIILALPHEVPIDPINGCVGMGQGGPFLWVNQDAERFVDENLAAVNFELQTVPMWNHKMTYMVFDSEIFRNWCNSKSIDHAGGLDIFEKALETNEGDSFWSADTISNLATKAGIPADELVKTVDYYNESCELADDREYGKAPAMMQRIATPPFYIGRITAEILMTIGGIGTNRNYEVITPEWEPIPGLYAVGTDGNMLYRDIYTINVPGTCSSSGINGARVAARKAFEYIG